MTRKIFFMFTLFFMATVMSSWAQSPFDVNTKVNATKKTGPGLVEFKGTITQWEKGKNIPLQGATVIIGSGISMKSNGGNDTILNAKKIAASVTTNSKGGFTAKIPAGNHAVILWKKHYIPATYTAKAPGTFKGTISVDKQAGASGRHLMLILKK